MINAIERTAKDQSDFLVTSHCVSLFGYCGDCLVQGLSGRHTEIMRPLRNYGQVLMRTITRRSRELGAWVTLTCAALIAVSLIAVGCGRKEETGKLKVAASIVPLGDFCRRVGGDMVEVRVLVPPGASPHTFEPTTKQMKFLSDADVLVLNGLELETWVSDVVEKAGNTGLLKVVAGEEVPGADLLKTDEERGSGSEHHEHGVYNPHVWLDPMLAIYEVEAISEGFAEADPDNARQYKKNAEDYIDKLKALDAKIRAETSSFSRKQFISFHPSFTYFARRYGLDEVGSIEELPGKEPSARDFAALVEKMKAQGVVVVFAERQLNPQTAEALANEAGTTVAVRTLDPLGNPDDLETSSYLKMMEHNVQVMTGVMK